MRCDPDFRPMAQAALVTGARYGELASLRMKKWRPCSSRSLPASQAMPCCCPRLTDRNGPSRTKLVRWLRRASTPRSSLRPRFKFCGTERSNLRLEQIALEEKDDLLTQRILTTYGKLLPHEKPRLQSVEVKGDQAGPHAGAAGACLCCLNTTCGSIDT
jgi:hypothetical protein